MSKAEYPVTQAVRFLRSKKIDFVPYVYAYEEHGGTARFAECTGKPEHQVIFINGGKRGFIVGMKPENLRTLNPKDVHVAVDS